jgi:hypothetical protein
MTPSTESTVHDARPPRVVVRATNLIVRPLLRTPAAKLITPLALLEFHGRRSGQRRRIVVAWHVVDDLAFVISPARWRTNFDGGHPATVHHQGCSTTLIGTLQTDPATVASAINRLLDNHATTRSLALHIPDGHTLDADDIADTHRALIQFQAV